MKEIRRLSMAVMWLLLFAVSVTAYAETGSGYTPSATAYVLADFDAGTAAEDFGLDTVTVDGITCGVFSGRGYSQWVKTNRSSFSKFTTFRLYAYSPCASESGDAVTIYLSESPTGASSAPHFKAVIPVDWTGWREVIIPVESLTAYSSPSLKNIQSVFFGFGRNGTTYLDGTELYIRAVCFDDPTVQMSEPSEEGVVVFDASVQNTAATNITNTKIDGIAVAGITSTGKSKTSGNISAKSNMDWTACDEMRIILYCESDTDTDSLNVVFYGAGQSELYSYYSVPLDFTGWNMIRIPLGDFQSPKGCVNPEDIGDLRLNMGGWSAVTTVGTNVYIDKIWVCPDYDVGYGAGVGIDEDNGVYTASYALYGERAQTAKIILAFYEEDGTLAACVVSDEVTPLNSRTELMVSTVAEGRAKAFVFAPDGITPIARSSDYYDSIKGIDISGITDEDFERAAENWVKYLCGDENNDLQEAEISKKIASVTSDARSYMNSMNTGSDIVELWGSKAITTSGEMTDEYSKLLSMATAYGTYGSELYQDETLKEKILFGLEWMYNNRYGEAEIKGTGWRSPTAFNWWDWEIGTPKRLISTLMIMRNELTQEQLSAYLTPADALISPNSDTGSNRVNFCKLVIGCGILEKDAQKIAKAIRAMRDSFEYTDDGTNDGQGFRTDGTYLYHGRFPMNGLYGIEHFSTVASLLPVLNGTGFSLPEEYIGKMKNWTFDSFAQLNYKGNFMRMFTGRSNTNGTGVSRTTITAMLDMLDAVDSETALRMKRFIKYTVINDTISDYYSSLSLDRVAVLKEIMDDESIEPEGNGRFNKVYSQSDKTVHFRDDFAYGVSMFSSRVYNYESINNTNMNGWYQSDGMTYLYNDDLRQYNSSYWNNVDPYMLPGTTVDTQEREAVSIRGVNSWLSSKDFVGGVSLGEYGVSAMELEGFHNSVAPTTTATSYGGEQPLHDCTLEAKKAWFMFDDEIVSMGTDINADDGYNVLTVIENRKGSTNYPLTLTNSGGTVSGSTAGLSDEKWLHLEATGGYYFPEGASVNTELTSGSVQFRKLWLDHGISPKDGGYIYATLPGKTVSETGSYAQSPDIEILNNDGFVQAVYERTLGVTGMVFWEAGAFDGVSVSQPAILMLRENGNDYELSVSDPTQKLDRVRVRLPYELELVSGTRVEDISVSGGTTAVAVNTKGAKGASVVLKLSKLTD